MTSVVIVMGLTATASTVLGGVLTLALKDHVRLISGLSAGAVVGVAVLELAPEALRHADPGRGILLTWLCIALGFIGYLTLDRDLPSAKRSRAERPRHLGPASLTLHSLLDGLGIGLAFQASSAMGLSVAIAVIAHDLSDGANTVSLSRNGGSGRAVAAGWLAADAIAPLVGIALAQMFAVPQRALSPILAGLAGGLLYLGFGTLLRSLGGRPLRAWSLLAPALGFGFIYGVARLARV
jgi:ZIP family zinc transporter